MMSTLLHELLKSQFWIGWPRSCWAKIIGNNVSGDLKLKFVNNNNDVAQKRSDVSVEGSGKSGAVDHLCKRC